MNPDVLIVVSSKIDHRGALFSETAKQGSVVVLIIPVLSCEKNAFLPCMRSMSFSWCLKLCTTFPAQTKIPGGSRSQRSWVGAFVLVFGRFFLHVLFLLHKF